MKKTLLFFLLLFTNYFYAQVSDIEHCYWNTQFDLTVNKSILLNNLNEAETTISYHLSAGDATANINAIAQPTAFTSLAPSSTIYARIDNKGTVTTNFFNLKLYDEIKFIPLTSTVRCYGQNDGVLTVAPSGGKTPYAYSLDGGPFIVYIGNPVGNFTNLSAGTHTIAVKDALGCSSMTQSVQITQPTILSAIPYTENQTVIISASGGTPPYQYSSDGANYQAGYTFSNLTPGGPYTFRVKDAQGCITTVNATIYPTLVLASTIVKPIDCISNATVSVTATGGKASYLYAVNKSSYQASNVFTNLTAGYYVFEVKDALNNVRYAYSTIAEFEAFSFTTAKTDATTNDDNDGTITVMASGGIKPYTYTLTDNTGVTLKPAQTSNIFTGLKSGSYGIQVKDAGNCTASQTNISILKKPIALFATASISPITCLIPTGTITVVATGGKAPYKYSLNNGNIFVDSNVFSGLVPGAYTLGVRDADNKEIVITAVLSPLDLPSVRVTSFSDVRCKGDNTGSVIVAATGGKAPYVYSLNGGVFSTNNTFTNLRVGAYNIAVQDTNGCSANVAINISEPAIEISATAIAINDQGIIVNASGGTAPYLYFLQNNNGIVIAGPQTNGVFTKLPVGRYSAQVTDANGCGYIHWAINVIPSTELVATTNITPITCINPTGTITVTATGGIAPYSYSIDNGVNYVTSNTFSNLSAGNYIINVKDSQNNTTSISTSIIPYAPLTSTAAITKTIDCVSNGTINVTASGGRRPYQYSLDNGVTYTSVNTFKNINAGTYFVRVKDSLDCATITNTIIIGQPVPLTATATSTKIVNCSINYDSTITIAASGGQAPYQYAVNSSTNYQTDNMYFGAAPGTHIVYVKDASGCIFTTTLVIESPSSLTLTATIAEATVCGGKNSVTLNATGGQAPYTYSFTGGTNYSPVNINDLSEGGYTLFTKDSYGCIATVYITVAHPTVPITTIWTINNTTGPNNSDGSVTVLASGGTAPFTYSLLNSNNVVIIPAQSSNTFNNLIAGTYGVIVKDAKGCSSNLTLVTISSPSLLSAVATVSQPSCDNPTGVITIIANGGSGVYQYSIDNGKTFTSSNVFIVMQPGNYMITVRDSQNVIYTQNLIVMPLNPMFLNALVVSNVTCVSNGIITATVSGGQAPYSYSLNGGSFQSTNIFAELNPGNYTIAVKDANGCIEIVNIILSSPTPIVATVTTDNQNIIVTAAGGVGNYQYSLDGITFQTSNIFTNVNYGTYQLFVRDQNGCLVTIITTVDPPAPLIDGKNIITIEFKPGQTLGDLVINGQNIKWYTNQNPLGGKTTKSSEVTLPLTTLLVDGTTYYASQTINGIESIERLAVTAKLNGSLSAPDFVLGNFKYYPNPVQHTLNIDNPSTIDEIEIISVSGKSVLAKKINNTHSEIDLSNVAAGVYVLKVKSEGHTKTIKIVKK